MRGCLFLVSCSLCADNLICILKVDSAIFVPTYFWHHLFVESSQVVKLLRDAIGRAKANHLVAQTRNQRQFMICAHIDLYDLFVPKLVIA